MFTLTVVLETIGTSLINQDDSAMPNVLSPEKQEFIASLDENPLMVTEVQVRGELIHYWTPNTTLLNDSQKVPTVEPDLLDWIDTLPENAVFYDIGASNGPFSMYAARKHLQVVSFEPEAQNFAALEMNHYLNRQAIRHPLIPMQFALSNAQGVGDIYMRNYIAGYHMKILEGPVRRMGDGDFVPCHVQKVLTDTLDDLTSRYQLPFPEYIKIDVDGAEYKLLEGAAKTLSDPRCKEIMIELVYPEDKAQGGAVIDVLSSHGFNVKSFEQVEHYEGLYNYLFTK